MGSLNYDGGILGVSLHILEIDVTMHHKHGSQRLGFGLVSDVLQAVSLKILVSLTITNRVRPNGGLTPTSTPKATSAPVAWPGCVVLVVS